MARIAQSLIVALQRFAKGLADDYDAIKAGLMLSWSTSPVEGQGHRSHRGNRCLLRSSARDPTSPHLVGGLPNDLLGLGAQTMPTSPRCSLQAAPPPGRRPTDARVPSTPRGTSAPQPAVTIKAGAGWGPSAPTAIPAVA